MIRYVFFVLFCFFSCSESTTLPNSTGKNSEVVFIVSDKLWENFVEKIVKEIFEDTIDGLSKKEQIFSLLQVNHNEFNSIFKKHKNIIIIEEGVENYSTKNKWALNQFVAQLNWNNDSRIFLNELIKLRSILILKEISFIRRNLSKNSQKKMENKLKKNFNIDFVLPKEYDVLKIDSTLFWANHDPQKSDEIKNIMIFSFNPKKNNLQQQVLNNTDSVFSKYLIGEKQGSYVKIESDYPPYYFENTYRGIWKLEHGFMGGPFLIKTYFIDEKIIVSVGLVFAPQNTKRKYIKEFEAIL
tara:strand:- start:473 stop:1366 length:894 start_codon:yes stop_codon:yes gene_type:complete